MFLNSIKLELIKKIANAKLTKAELQAITEKAEEILNRRPEPKKE